MSRVILTGASGFIGGHLESHLLKAKMEVDSIVRMPTSKSAVSKGRRTCVHSLDEYSFTLSDVDTTVVHLAARAHILHDVASDTLAEYRKANTEVTLRFAKNAANAGVKRLVFISTIKVNGERTASGHAFRSGDTPSPEDPYAISKHEAEVGLKRIAEETGMEVVIIRPPLVYGPGVKGNFSTLMSAVRKGLPLPLGSIHNKRSMVGIHNLVDLIECAIRHPNAAGKTFLVSDGHDFSTTELLSRMIKSSGSKSILLPIPPFAIHLAASILGKRDMSARLLESLQVDISDTMQTLDWKPPFTVEQELASCFTQMTHD